jgi:hydrogenase maturation protease
LSNHNLNDPTRIDRKVVLGLGNLLLSDEGLGLHAMRLLRDQIESSMCVEFVDGGVLGLDLLPLVETTSHLLVIDALDAGLPPGSLVELIDDQIPRFAGIKLSQHQLGFQEVLGVAQFRGWLPEHLHLVGVQPASIQLGLELSAPVKQVLPQAVSRAKDVLAGWIN